MRAFLIAALCISLSYAKPQYNYPAPSIPSGIYGVPGSGATQIGSDFSQTGSSFVPSASHPSEGGFSGGAAVVPVNFIPVQNCYSGNQGIPGTRCQQQGATRGLGGYAAGGGTLIHKHIYVHVAPPDPEEARPQRPIPAGQTNKHYKIIFIKAPSYQSYQQQIIQQQTQNEEKTLVYVLVKKPDEPADITVPAAAPTAPSKPEVYFIKYKAKSEVTGGGAYGSQLSGAGTGIGGLSTGDSSSSEFVNRLQTSYGPPAQGVPY